MDADGGDDEQDSGEHGEDVGDDRRPVGPRQVDADVVVDAHRAEQPQVLLAAEQFRRHRRVRLGVVRVSSGAGAERRYRRQLQHS